MKLWITVLDPKVLPFLKELEKRNHIKILNHQDEQPPVAQEPESPNVDMWSFSGVWNWDMTLDEIDAEIDKMREGRL